MYHPLPVSLRQHTTHPSNRHLSARHPCLAPTPTVQQCRQRHVWILLNVVAANFTAIHCWCTYKTQVRIRHKHTELLCILFLLWTVSFQLLSCTRKEHTCFTIKSCKQTRQIYSNAKLIYSCPCPGSKKAGTRSAIHWATRTTDFLPRHITTVARNGRRTEWLLLMKVSDWDRNVKVNKVLVVINIIILYYANGQQDSNIQ